MAWLAGGALILWLWIALFQGGFWRADQRLRVVPDTLVRWPAIAVVIPARDEAQTIAEAVTSLVNQDYAGGLTIIVVNDNSTDGTAALAISVTSGACKIDVVDGQPLPDGWTGKMWAVALGIERVETIATDVEYLLLTDADIEHSSDSLRALVVKAESENLDLVSLMVKLRDQNHWENLLVPAFVFFFQKLFPFPWVNNPSRSEAAAAGGCILVKRAAMARIGGVSCIRDRVIDDCALAAAIKPGGAIWLGLAENSHSLRGYDGLRGLWDMVARTAFVQLNNSYLLLFGTIFGMVVLYLAPPLAVLVGIWLLDSHIILAGLLSWILMTFLYIPTIRLYNAPLWRAVFLPIAALIYTAMTLSSAWRTFRGRGAGWKGRSYGSPGVGSEKQEEE
jgi:hopene-associated glycosyltransferase HpnB